MDQLLQSRRNKDEPLTPLEHLSPDKFGPSAYVQLAYTPSKLAGNVIFKEASFMRRAEKHGSRIRESEASNHILREKLKHVLAEKAGIELSLGQQIVMYRQMVGEAEEALEVRVRELQASFSAEMLGVIQDKEEEGKYVQAEKEMMENRIFELEDLIAGMKQDLDSRAKAIEDSRR